MTMQGFALGAVLTGLITPRAPSNDILNTLIKDKPEFYKFVDIDLSTARTNQVYDEPGTFIWVDNQFARGEVTLRLNELQFGKFDLRRQKYIQGPFYRFFITNVTGQGSIRLFVSRGYQAASEPIEAINRAELAARLGSIVTFDRKGDVVFMDDFESGIGRWLYVASEEGGAVTWSSTTSRIGGYSAKLVSGTGGDKYAGLTLQRPMPVLDKVGLEVSFYMASTPTTLDFRYYVYSTDTYYNAQVIYDVANVRLRYRDSANDPQDLITSYTLYKANPFFHTLKMVFDLSTAEYVRVLLNEREVSMDGVGITTTSGGPWTPYMGVELVLWGDDETNHVLYVDNVILTQNEP